MYLSAPFILQNFYKKILEMIQSYEDARHFRDQNNPFVLNKNFLLQTTTHPELWRCTIFGPIVVHLPNFFYFFFFEEGGIITIILIYLLAPFIVQNLGPKMAHFPK